MPEQITSVYFYDPIAMPPDLLKAYQNLGKAVMRWYGFPVKGFTEGDCVAALMERYQHLLIKNRI